MHVHRNAPATLYAVKVHQGIRKTPATIPFNCLKPSRNRASRMTIPPRRLKRSARYCCRRGLTRSLSNATRPPPAANHVTDAIPEGGCRCYEKQKQHDVHPSLSGLRSTRDQQGLPGSGDSHAFRHHSSEGRAVAFLPDPIKLERRTVQCCEDRLYIGYILTRYIGMNAKRKLINNVFDQQGKSRGAVIFRVDILVRILTGCLRGEL